MLAAFAFLCLLSPPGAFAGFGDVLKNAQKMLGGDTAALSETEIASGLKEALKVGTTQAVATVSEVDGFYGNPDIRIPLPETVRKLEGVLRTAGFGSEVDAFKLSMNRAAEEAAPEAKALFLDAIGQMSFDDADRVLKGREDEATRYFQEKTSDRLQTIFKPVIHQTMATVGTTRAYQDLNAQVERIPFTEPLRFDLDQYVTDQALEGLFYMVAQEEARIRQDPGARVTELLQKVFGN
jgi:hypothetical protein